MWIGKRKKHFSKKSIMKALKSIERKLPKLAHPLVFTVPLKDVDGLLCLVLPSGALPFPRNYFSLPPSRRQVFWLQVLDILLAGEGGDNSHPPTSASTPHHTQDLTIGEVVISVFSDRFDVDICLPEHPSVYFQKTGLWGG